MVTRDSNMAPRENSGSPERGFTILQLLTAVALIGVVTAVAVVGIARSRDSLRLQSSVRQLSNYLEKARLDAVRRHATASVTFTSTTSYNVVMDFDGNGTTYTRAFPLESGVSLISTPLPSITYNWRGRTSACTFTFAFQNTSGDQSWVDVADAGDITINGDVSVLPNVSFTSVNSNADVVSDTVVSGSGTHNNTVDCSISGSGSVGPPITGTGVGCTMTANPSSLSVTKNGGSGSITLSTTGSGTYTITTLGPSNLSISPASKSVAAGSSQSFSVKSLNNTRGTFAVNFSSYCTTVTVAVKVTN